MAIQKIPNTLIADNAVTAAKIANGSLTADDIAANSITAAKLSASTSPTFGGLTVTGTGTLTLASNTMTTSADFTIDSAGDINLDAGGSDIKFRGSGLLFGQISRNGGGDFILRSYLSDKDTIFQGNDGGSVITALTLDMSEAGQATFNAGATFGGNVGIGTSDPQKALDIAGASSSGGAVMRLSGTGEASQGNVTGAIQFYSADTTDNTPGVFGMLRGIAGASGGEGSLQILTDMPSEGADASNITMHFNSNGNVGIGTSSPTQKLDVNGNIAVGYDSNSTHQILKTYATNHASGNQGGILQLGIYDGSFAGMKVVNTASSVTNYNSQYISFETHEGAVSVAERMRITSGGTLLLGQTTANANAAVFELTGKNSTQGTIRITPDSNKGSEVSHIHYGSTGDWYIRSASTSGKVIINDAGGNVGIGETSPDRQVHVKGTSTTGGRLKLENTQTSAYAGIIMTANPREYHIGVGGSAVAAGLADSLYFYDGTAGLNRMSLNSSGELLIGTTTSEGKLTVEGDASAGQFTALALKQDAASNDQSAGMTCDMDFYLWDSNTRISTPQARIGVKGDSTANQNYEAGGQLCFYTNIRSNTSPSLTERMRIDSSGNVGIGTSSPDAKLNVNLTGAGDAVKVTGSSITDFEFVGNPPEFNLEDTSSTSGQKRARLTLDSNKLNIQGLSDDDTAVTHNFLTCDLSSGRVVFGGSSSFAHNTYAHAAVFTKNSTPQGTVVIEDSDVSSGIGNTVLNLFLRDQDPATSATFIDFRDGGGRVGSVTHKDDGSGVNYNVSSDYRLKENIDYDWDALTLVTQLKPAKFNFIRKPDKTVQGFLAHEVSEIVPNSVTGNKDHIEPIGTITDSDGNTVHEGVYEHFCKTDEGQTWTQTGTEAIYQQLDQSKLVPLLTKAIQELSTKLEAAEARITELEG